MTRARDLSRLSSPVNFTVDALNNRVGLGSTTPTAKLNVSGIVSATSFYGDGSNLEGVASAGLGTAVEAGSAFGGEQIYYTNTVLRYWRNSYCRSTKQLLMIGYTQYQEIAVESRSRL